MRVGIVGATGLVGSKLIQLLEKSTLPIEEIRFIASSKSSGNFIKFKNKSIEIYEISDKVFNNLNLIFFMASKEIALKYVPVAAKHGVVIDNSSAFRMKEDIPLVVPEVNFSSIKKANRIIANPNCSTIQLVVILHQLGLINEIERVDVSTYQAVSGAGKEAINEYYHQVANFRRPIRAEILPVKDEKIHYPIFNNVIPQIDVFDKNGFTKEELKVINESQKILNKKISISCTAVRVPVYNCHSESVTITFKNSINIEKMKEVLQNGENIIVLDDYENQEYPLATLCNGKTEVFVGRIRKDLYNDFILHLWIVADNLLKGAAANALEIALKCYKEKIFGW